MSHIPPAFTTFQQLALSGKLRHYCCLRPHASAVHEMAVRFSDAELEQVYDLICCPGAGDEPPGPVPQGGGGGQTPQPQPPSPTPHGNNCANVSVALLCSPAGRAALSAFVKECDDYVAKNGPGTAEALLVLGMRAAVVRVLDSCDKPHEVVGLITGLCAQRGTLLALYNRLPETVRSVLTPLLNNPLMTGPLGQAVSYCCR